jgi:hypothetical protein
MKKNLAQRMRERKAARKGVQPAPAPLQEVVEEEEDAAELEYQEKTTRKKRSIRKKKDQD